MNKILVCINDGLLKLRVRDVLNKQNFSFQITDKPIKKDDLYIYDLVVIHTSYKLNGLNSFVENIVLNKLATVFLITTNINSSLYRHLEKSTNMMIIDESRMTSELPLSILHFNKFNKRIKELESQNKELSEKLEESRLMSKCKRLLMSVGRSEEEAHKYIVKYAMDNQINKIDACKRLLNE